MTRDELLQRLACFAAGDLDPDRVAEIESALVDDEGLQRLLADLQAQVARAPRLLARDDVPAELMQAPVSAVAPANPRGRGPTMAVAWRPLLAGSAVAAMAVLFVAGGRVISPPLVTVALADPRLAALEQAFHHGMDPGNRLEAPAAALPGLLRTAGAPAHLAQVSDLSEIGLELAGAVVLPGDPVGVGVLYRRGADLLLCQQWDEVSALGPPAHAEVIGATQVRAYEVHGLSMVVFTTPRMVWVLTAELPVGELLALARLKLGD